MTERALQALTWATLAAALVGAGLLAAFGCVLPESLHNSSNRLLSIASAISECDAPTLRVTPLEALQRAWERHLVLPKP
jgi:hypothetical protein